VVSSALASERGATRRPPSSLTRLRRLNRFDSSLLGTGEFNGRKVTFRTLSAPYRGPRRAATAEQRLSAILDRNLDVALRQNFAPSELPSQKVRFASELHYVRGMVRESPGYRRHVVVAHDEAGNILAFTRALVRTGQFEDGPLSVALRAFRWTHPDFRGGGLAKALDSHVVPLLRQQAHVLSGEIERFTPEEHSELQRLQGLPHVQEHSSLQQELGKAPAEQKPILLSRIKKFKKSLDVEQNADIMTHANLSLRNIRIYAQHGLGAKLALAHYFAPDGKTPWPGHFIVYPPEEGQEVVRNGRVVVGPNHVDADFLRKAVSLLHQPPIYASDEGRAMNAIVQNNPRLSRSESIPLESLGTLLPLHEQPKFYEKEAAKRNRPLISTQV